MWVLPGVYLPWFFRNETFCLRTFIKFPSPFYFFPYLSFPFFSFYFFNFPVSFPFLSYPFFYFSFPFQHPLFLFISFAHPPFFLFGSHLAVFRDYTKLCAQETLLEFLGHQESCKRISYLFHLFASQLNAFICVISITIMCNECTKNIALIGYQESCKTVSHFFKTISYYM